MTSAVMVFLVPDGPMKRRRMLPAKERDAGGLARERLISVV
jgi:hypothetical protein